MIAIVEDEKGIRDLLSYALKNSGFEVRSFATGAAFWDSLSEELPQLLLLDIMLPGEDGISILRRLRERNDTRRLPIILLTAKDAEYDKIIGLDNGADDYVTKPFGMMELISRIKALLRRTADDAPPSRFIYEDLMLDDQAHKVTVAGETVDVTLKEYNTLKLLLQKQGRVLSREDLLNAVWGYAFDGETRTVDVHIRTLRVKLGASGAYIQTVRGVGYTMGVTP